MPPLREHNPELSPRTDRAVMWAMNLHPEDRPQNVEQFQEALLGRREPAGRSGGRLPSPSLADILSTGPERNLAWAAAALFILSLVATINH
jgi:serine/threonine-protein kinase